MFEQWNKDVIKRVNSYKNNESLKKAGYNFLREIEKVKYAYNFSWMGFPILQITEDMYAFQEIIWRVKPDLIIETGVAYGGSVIFCASMLTLLEACGEIENGDVLGIEINLYPESQKAIFTHPLSKKITILEGSSTNEKIIEKVREFSKHKKRIIVFLDANHVHEHVLAELRAYAPLVCVGSYIIVEDTGIEELPDGTSFDRPWGKGNNPKTAVQEFLKENKNFEIDKMIDLKLIFTGTRDGRLKRIR